MMETLAFYSYSSLHSCHWQLRLEPTIAENRKNSALSAVTCTYVYGGRFPSWHPCLQIGRNACVQENLVQFSCQAVISFGEQSFQCEKIFHIGSFSS